MTFSFDDMITVEEILADVLPAVNDEEIKNFTKGWYTRQVKTGLDNLNYTAPFLETFIDVDITSNLIIPVPSGVWDLRDLFIWNGSTGCDTCVITEAIRLFHKRNYHTLGYDYSYTSRHMSHSSDYLLPAPYSEDSTTYFYNTHLGNIVLSDACISYEKLRIVYNGVPKSLNTVKFIPPFCREALSAFVVEKAFSALKAKDPAKYRGLWADAKQDLYEMRGTEPSKWDRAQAMLKSIDRKAFNDLSEYLGELYY